MFRYSEYRFELHAVRLWTFQGSTLRSLPFLLFINNLAFSLTYECLVCADNDQLYFSVQSEQNCLHLARVYKNCINSKLTFNANKCKVLTFTHIKKAIILNYTLNGLHLVHSDTTEDLGITFDSGLSFTDHI